MAAVACQIHASCMVWRVCSKFGKSSTNPLHAMMIERKSTPPQNQTFSPPLKRADGGCSFLRKNAHARRSQVKSHERKMLSRAQMITITATETMKSGAMKLCTFFENCVSQPKSV